MNPTAKIDDMMKATIVSFCPFSISEKKPGLNPGVFELIASDETTPRVLTIGDATYPVYIDETRGSLTITVHAHKIAASIVNDFFDTQLGASANCHPALFWVPGRWTPEQILKEFPEQVQQVLQAQKNWYVRLVEIGDDDWERVRQHTAISDIQRAAAKKLGLDRPWIIKVDEQLPVGGPRCIGCGQPYPAGAAVCPTCRCIVDPVKFATLKFA